MAVRKNFTFTERGFTISSVQLTPTFSKFVVTDPKRDTTTWEKFGNVLKVLCDYSTENPEEFSHQDIVEVATKLFQHGVEASKEE